MTCWCYLNYRLRAVAASELVLLKHVVDIAVLLPLHCPLVILVSFFAALDEHVAKLFVATK